jgi:hypothetical protein
LQGIWITLHNEAAHALIEAQRGPKVTVEDSIPVLEILLPERDIEAVRMACGSDVCGRRSLAEHLQNGITRNEVNKQKDN